MSGYKKLMQWLILASAGSASFYGAMVWRSSPETSDSGLVGMATRATPRTVSAEAAIRPPSSTSESPYKRDGNLTPPDRTRVAPRSGGDAFAKLSWLPLPPPVVHVAPSKPAPPPAPSAPPIPFTFVGLMESGGPKPQAFLSKGDALLVVAAGEVIDNNTYRVEALNAKQIVITYLPLNTTQTLFISGISK